MRERRTIVARVVVVLAALLIVAAAIAGYVRHELLVADRFSDRATAALKDRDVRDLVAREVTDKVVLKADPDLLAARPLIESVTSGIAGSGPFLALYGSGIRRLHASVLSGHDSRLELDLRDAGVLVGSALETLKPSVAKDIDVRDVKLTSSTRVADDAASVARGLRRDSWILLALALVAGAAGLMLAPVTRTALRLLGVATGVAALVAYAALHVGERVAAGAIGGDELSHRAFAAVWSALLGDLGSLLLLVAAAGAVTAAIATTRGDLPDLEPMLARTRAKIGATPRTDRARAARALAFVVVGVLALLDPDGVVRTVVSIAGILLVYAGADQLLGVLQRRLGPGPAASTAPGHRRARTAMRAALPAAVVAVIALAGIAAFAGSGTVDPPAVASVTNRCNGHAELCAKRLDEVVLPATHNAMSAADLPGWFSAEQQKSIPDQLRAGVRGLLIDAHYGIKVKGGVRTDLGPASERAGDADRALYVKTVGAAGLNAIGRIRDRVIPGGGKPGVYLCHRFCELGATALDDALGGIHDFLVLNPGEVIAIVIEGYVTPADVVASFRRSGLSNLVYTGPPAGPFPTLREMVDRNQRVVVYAERNGGAAPWYTAGYAKAIQETPYTFKSAKLLTDPANLPASCAPNRGPATAPLFLVNHWVNTDPTPKISSAAAVNTKAALVARADACRKIRGHLPNLLAVNFYGTGDLFAAADELNDVG